MTVYLFREVFYRGQQGRSTSLPLKISSKNLQRCRFPMAAPKLCLLVLLPGCFVLVARMRPLQYVAAQQRSHRVTLGQLRWSALSSTSELGSHRRHTFAQGVVAGGLTWRRWCSATLYCIFARLYTNCIPFCSFKQSCHTITVFAL